MPDRNYVGIAVAWILALLTMNGYAVANRLKRKDAYDICYSVSNFPDGIDAFIAATGISRNEREETPTPGECL